MSKFQTKHNYESKGVKTGLPVNLMLGKALKEYEAIKKALKGKVGIQSKYDGERSQVHFSRKGRVEMYSRGFEK